GRASTGPRSTSRRKYRGISRRLDGGEKGRIKPAARNLPPGRNRRSSLLLSRLLQQPLAEGHDRRSLGNDLRTYKVIGRLGLELDVEGRAQAPRSKVGVDQRTQRKR